MGPICIAHSWHRNALTWPEVPNQIGHNQQPYHQMQDALRSHSLPYIFDNNNRIYSGDAQ